MFAPKAALTSSPFDSKALYPRKCSSNSKPNPAVQIAARERKEHKGRRFNSTDDGYAFHPPGKAPQKTIAVHSCLYAFFVFSGGSPKGELEPWVVMPNHVHVIVRPLGTHLLDEILQSWKGFTGCEANTLWQRLGQPFWAREYYDHLVRDDTARAQLADYLHDNPAKAGLCTLPEDWKWSSAYHP